jgi:putative membrane protein
MPEAKRLLIMVVDIDDDLHEKAKLKGPVVGRKANLEAASKLAVVDPQEVDANAIFAAVKMYDELSKDHVVEVATFTGSRVPGFQAQREVVKQLEKVIADFAPEAAVFVSDGAADEQIIPLVSARIKIQSIHTIVMKQTKELEKTYFVLLEKLKEPAFARVIFGVPGAALLLYFLVGWDGIRYFTGLLGFYLILKGLGVEEWLGRHLSTENLSFGKVSSVVYMAAIPLGVVAIALGWSAATTSGYTDLLLQSAVFVKQLLLLVIAALLVVGGHALEAYYEDKKYLYPGYLVSASAIILFSLLFSVAADWILDNASFGDFFTTLMLTVFLMLLVIFLSREFRKDILIKMHLEGKEAYTEIGIRLGKIVGVNKLKDTFIVETDAGSKIDMSVDYITHLGDKVIIRY